MNIKKIGLTGLIGFVAMAVVGGLSSGLYHAKHMTELSQKFPGIVQWPFDMVPPLVGMLVYIFVMAIIYDKMGVVGYKQGAITGAWFGAAKWFFFNSQMMGIMPNVWGDVNYIIIDTAISAVMYAIQGAAMGWALDRFK